jgi:Putative Ig domain
VTAGTAISFQWPPAADPDGDAIADYHFELSTRADMKWPLSMTFAKLISRTADNRLARYSLPGPGLLNPDTKYFWHVRARDDKGVWGPWSPTWSFTAQGPSPPQNLSVEFDPEHTRGVLRWTPGPLGRKPAAYRVYASDEKGFTASDEAYPVTVGVSDTLPSEFPANFVAETSASELEVVGPHVKLPGANKAFYRVVAVDAAGNRSGPSDYAASPRPVIVSTPDTQAGKGVAYRYRVAAIRSLGDLRTRVVNGKETMNYWDVERLRFAIGHGPRWLTIDETTGLLSGTPDRSSAEQVVVSVTLDRDARRLDEAALKWGVEKIVSSGAERVGSATQRFTIDVRP